jgi:hypothetical protein
MTHSRKTYKYNILLALDSTLIFASRIGIYARWHRQNAHPKTFEFYIKKNPQAFTDQFQVLKYQTWKDISKRTFSYTKKYFSTFLFNY